MNSILITGGAGYIGTHLVLELLENNFRVIIADSFANSSEKAIQRILKLVSNKKYYFGQNIKFHKGDIRDIKFLISIFEEAIRSGQHINAVIHLAGLKSVHESIKNPSLYWDVNFNGTIKLLNIMRDFHCWNFVFSSSATVYSPELQSPLFEDMRLDPIDPYGKTKLAVENSLRDLSKNLNEPWNIISLRYFNPIGAHPSGEIGESPLNIPSNLFPYICEVAISKREFLNIYGNDWPTKDGTCIRDFIHIMDLSEGHLAALNYLLKENSKKSFLVVNLGTGKGYSVLELVTTFEKVNNLEINYKFSERRKGDKAIVYSNCDLAKKLFNWEAKRNISEMCIDGWHWKIKNPNGY